MARLGLARLPPRVSLAGGGTVSIARRSVLSARLSFGGVLEPGGLTFSPAMKHRHAAGGVSVAEAAAEARPRVGISACLLGQEVRWDGRHKRDPLLADTLARHLDFVPVCPEVAIGLGVPRGPLRLEGDAARPRAVQIEPPRRDVTAALAEQGRRAARELDGLCGFVFKGASPSCGVERVPVRGARGGTSRRGVGRFARALMDARPELPVEEEGRLARPGPRDSFIERVFAYRRWLLLARGGLTPARIAAFHARQELALMARGADDALARLLARSRGATGAALAARYLPAFMEALRRPIPRRGHVRVLKRLVAALDGRLSRPERVALRAAVRAYRAGQTPLALPLDMLRRHGLRQRLPGWARQTYLNPEPGEWALRFGP